MKNHLFSKRIPTILGISLVVIGLVITTAVINLQTNLKSKASISKEPQNIKITNVSDNSFAITYQTDAATTGSTNFGKDKSLGNTELDDSDKEKGRFSSKNIHSITLKKLSPQTKYYFVIISGENTFLNNSVPFETVTASKIASSSSSQITVKGKILLPDGNPPDEALVFVNTENSQLLSTRVAQKGEFSFSLKEIRSKNLKTYPKLNDNTILKLLVIDKSLKSTVSISLNQAHSIPTITLSNDYNFINTSTTVASKSAEFLGFPIITTKPEVLKPEISTPKKDQSFTEKRPLFRGKSLPNEKVEIIINSEEEIRDEAIADSNGNWSYRPPLDLSLGEHTITILTRDSSGILRSLTQSFTVYAESSSPTPTQKPTPTLTPTLIPFIPSPTTSQPANIIPTPIPTILLSPTLIPPESKGGLPPTGNESLIVFAVGGIFATLTGILIFLLI